MPDFEVFQSGDGEGGYAVQSSEPITNATMSGLLQAVTGEMYATSSYTGEMAGQLKAVTGNVSMKAAYIGTMAGTLQKVYGLMASGNVIAGTMAGTLRAVTGSMTGSAKRNIVGTMAGQLQSVRGLMIGSTQNVIIGMPINRQVTWDEGQTPNLIMGDVFWHTATIKAGNPLAQYDISPASLVKVRIVKADHTQALTDEVEISAGLEGASWISGIMTILIPAEITAQAESYITRDTLAKVEIQITLNTYKFTWYAPVRLIPGFIS